MPFDIKICISLDLIYVHWWGETDNKMRLQKHSDLSNEAIYRPGRTEFINLSGLKNFDWDLRQTQSYLRKETATLNGKIAPTRKVIWAPSDLAFGGARMYQSLADIDGHIRVEVYRHVDAAIAALGLNVHDLDALFDAYDFTPYTDHTSKPSGAVAHTAAGLQRLRTFRKRKSFRALRSNAISVMLLNLMKRDTT